MFRARFGNHSPVVSLKTPPPHFPTTISLWRFGRVRSRSGALSEHRWPTLASGHSRALCPRDLTNSSLQFFQCCPAPLSSQRRYFFQSQWVILRSRLVRLVWLCALVSSAQSRCGIRGSRPGGRSVISANRGTRHSGVPIRRPPRATVLPAVAFPSRFWRASAGNGMPRSNLGTVRRP